jgi:TatD DNase family protein
MQLIRSDIAVNLTDPMYRGEYHGKSRHTSDLENVVKRAREAGVERILITGTSLSESRAALDLAKQYSKHLCQARAKVPGLHCTAGCHPTSTSEIDQYPDGVDAYMRELGNFIAEDRGEGGSKRIISIGEIGLGKFMGPKHHCTCSLYRL